MPECFEEINIVFNEDKSLIRMNLMLKENLRTEL